jgi:hypothetical protein
MFRLLQSRTVVFIAATPVLFSVGGGGAATPPVASAIGFDAHEASSAIANTAAIVSFAAIAKILLFMLNSLQKFKPRIVRGIMPLWLFIQSQFPV